MKIRKATKKDIPEMVNLIKKEFAKPPYKEKWTTSQVQKTINNYLKIGYAYLAIENKKIIGIIVVRNEPYAGGMHLVLEELVVSSNLQGKGIGRELIKKIEKEIRKRKFHTIYLTAHGKSNAYKFYDKLGYKESKQMAVMGKKLK